MTVPSFFSLRPKSGKHVAAVLVAGVVLLNLVAGAAVAFELMRSREYYDSLSAVAATNLAQALEKNLANTLNQVDLTLQNVADEVLRQYAHEGRFSVSDLNAFIARQHSRVASLDSLRFADERGVVMYGVGVGDKHVSIAGREYFKRLRDDPGAGMVFSQVLLGSISGKLVMVLARSLRRPDGSFAGVVYGPITLDYFRQMFKDIDVGPNGVISLRDGQFAILVRSPQIAGNGAVGQRRVSDRFLQMVTANPTAGTYFAPTGSDDVDRVLSYRKVGGYPLYVITGLAKKDYLSSWYTEVKTALVLALLFLFATSWGGRILLLSHRDRVLSEERLSLLLNSAGEGIFGVDTQGACTFFNPAGLRILGYGDQAELLGKNVRDIVQGDPRQTAPNPEGESRLLRALALGQAHGADDEMFKRADGSPVAVQYWCSPQESGGRVVGAVVTFGDISERKRVETGLRQSEERFRTLVEHAPLPIVMLQGGKVRYANAKAAQAFGYAGAQAMQGLDAADLLDRRIPERSFSAAGEGADVTFEAKGRKADGAAFDLTVSSTVLRMADGFAALAFCQDISEAKSAQGRIRQLGEALKQSEEAIALFDDMLRFTYVNPAFRRLFGYTDEELHGQSAQIMAGSDDPENGAGPLQASSVARRFGGFRGEARRKAKDGGMVPLMLNVAPVKDDRGDVTGFVSVMTDLTEIKRTQEKLRRLAHFDPLTGLPNRALLADRLEMGLASAKRQGTSCALLFLDLDHFKDINDTLGHHTGDKLLKAAADVLRSQVRASDTVARLAGDEFVVFLPDVERPDHAALVARKILLAFERPFDLDGRTLHVTASIGVAFYPVDAADGPGLIKFADKAMYRAKERGRNAYALYAEPV